MWRNTIWGQAYLILQGAKHSFLLDCLALTAVQWIDIVVRSHRQRPYELFYTHWWPATPHWSTVRKWVGHILLDKSLKLSVPVRIIWPVHLASFKYMLKNGWCIFEEILDFFNCKMYWIFSWSVFSKTKGEEKTLKEILTISKFNYISRKF